MPKIAHTRNMQEIRHYTLNVFFGNPISNSQVKAILHGTMDKMKAGIQCRGKDIRKGRDVDVRNGREMVAGLNRK